MQLELTLTEFKNLIRNKRYFFHFHTNYTDGMLTLEDYFRWAKEKRIEVLIFCEHIRKRPTYSFEKFLNEVDQKAQRYNIKYVIGVEAKLLPTGELDISEEIFEKVNLVGWGCHSFPQDIELYKEALENLIYKLRKREDKIFVWVHPGRFLKKYYNLKQYAKLLKNLIKLAEKNGIFIEKNLRENLPPQIIWKEINQSLRITGVDAHRWEDLLKYEKNYMDH